MARAADLLTRCSDHIHIYVVCICICMYILHKHPNTHKQWQIYIYASPFCSCYSGHWPGSRPITGPSCSWGWSLRRSWPDWCFAVYTVILYIYIYMYVFIQCIHVNKDSIICSTIYALKYTNVYDHYTLIYITYDV